MTVQIGKTERRKDLRAPLIVQKVSLRQGRLTFFGYARNISRGGMFISATSPKEVGSRFDIEIPLPQPLGRRVRCSCEVVWQREWSRTSKLDPGMGVRLIDLPEDDAEAIDRWIEETRPRGMVWQ